jgi:cyclic pyranopterin phosphate synthase
MTMTGDPVDEEREEKRDSGEEPAAPVIDYLRISITDRCNLRCVYCMPAEGVTSITHSEILTYEELEMITRAAHDAGITRVRLTGGEPLVRRGAVDFVGMLGAIDPDLRITLTTNGVLLAEHAAALRRAGLSRVNISLDTLDPETYESITRVGRLEDALGGLDAAIDVGLDPIKINVVVLKGLNDDPVPFAELSRRLPVHVRFIEYMPYFGETGKWFVPSEVIKSRLSSMGPLEEVESPEGWGPAGYYRLPGAVGLLGFISPMTCHFCSSCNRLRVTADGKLRVCLFDSNGFNIKREIRAGADEERLREIIESELARKRAEGGHHKLGAARERAGDHMSRIGG